MNNTVYRVSVPEPREITQEWAARAEQERQERLEWVRSQLRAEHEGTARHANRGSITDRRAALIAEEARLTGTPALRPSSDSEWDREIEKEYRNRPKLVPDRGPRDGFDASAEGMLYNRLSKPTVVTAALTMSLLANKDPTKVGPILRRAANLSAGIGTAHEFGRHLADGESVSDALLDTGRTWSAASTRAVLGAADSILSAVDAVSPSGSGMEAVVRGSRGDIVSMLSGRESKLAGMDVDPRFFTYPDAEAERLGGFAEVYGRYGALGNFTIATDVVGSAGTNPGIASAGTGLMAGSKAVSKKLGPLAGFLSGLAGFSLIDAPIEVQREKILEGLDEMDRITVMDREFGDLVAGIREHRDGNQFDRLFDDELLPGYRAAAAEDGITLTPEQENQIREGVRRDYIKNLIKAREDLRK